MSPPSMRSYRSDDHFPVTRSTSAKLTFAFCTYNRAERLQGLVNHMRRQSCPIPFEMLAVDNNSTDHTVAELSRLASEAGPLLRWVTEEKQGIVPARNRAIQESINSDILVFIDDDETPKPGLLDAVTRAILEDGAQCVGGRIEIDFEHFSRPRWLDDELLGFLGALDHGTGSFWITDKSRPIWSGNIAYAMSLFRNDPELRFDERYNREGHGGGEDAMMLRCLIDRKIRIQYCPNMAVLHSVDPWKLKRRYFIKLHFRAGERLGQYQLPTYQRTIFGIPPFLILQMLRQAVKALALFITASNGALRQTMNVANTFGLILGYTRR